MFTRCPTGTCWQLTWRRSVTPEKLSLPNTLLELQPYGAAGGLVPQPSSCCGLLGGFWCWCGCGWGMVPTAPAVLAVSQPLAITCVEPGPVFLVTSSQVSGWYWGH